MTIYVDVVLLENVLMNYIILFTTGIINKANIKFLRILIASTLGGAYAVLAYSQILSNTVRSFY